MPDSYDPTMMLSDARNIGSASGGVASSSPGKAKADAAQAFDGTANTGTTTVVKDEIAPSKAPSGSANAIPAGVDKFGGGSV